MSTEQATYPYKFIEVRSSMGHFILTPKRRQTYVFITYQKNVILHANLLKSRAHGHMCR